MVGKSAFWEPFCRECFALVTPRETRGATRFAYANGRLKNALSHFGDFCRDIFALNVPRETPEASHLCAAPQRCPPE